MATAATRGASLVPWWVRAKAPWYGELFDRMALAPEDAAEQRVQRLREEALYRPEGREGFVSVQRARLMTQSYRLTEGEPEVIRRALALAHVLRHIDLPLSDYQLLAGTPASAPRTAEVEPEFQAGWLEEMVTVDGRAMRELDALSVRPVGAFHLDPADKEELEGEILPYWRQRNQKAVFLRELERNYPAALAYYRESEVYAHVVGVGLSHSIQDYASVLAKGLEGIAAEIEGYLAALDACHPASMADFERRNLHRAMLILVEAVVSYANRYADSLERKAADEDAARAAELREMARICRRVPAKPAESWWEALQSWSFLHTITFLTEGGSSHSAGRFDQYMLPYLERDLAAGRITLGRAQELLECCFLKFAERVTLRGVAGSRAVAGVGANDKLTIGGIDRYGRDATNRLSYMCLEAQAHVHLSEPNLSVRLHRNTPDDFLRCALEVVRLGGGLPQLISDEAIVPALVSLCGMTLSHARDYADIGCQENSADPNLNGVSDSNGRNNAGYFNLAKIVELALGDGVNLGSGAQAGPRTGDPRGFGTMAEFAQAVRAQLEYGVKMNVAFNNAFAYTFRRATPAVYHSLMHPGPRRTGLDYTEGGCKYNWTGAIAVGLANAADSLSAVEQVIYERRLATWDDLLGAIKNDWEGYAWLREACLAAPKYGSDDERGDRWAKFLADAFFDAYEQYDSAHGGRFVGGFFTMGHYLTRGELTAATPDGRRRGEPLSDSGVSPSIYAPVLGPTATHRSVTVAVDPHRAVNGVTFNQRLSQTAVSSPRELAKWADLVRTYVASGGQAVQYTVVDREALLDAQLHPDQYQDLIVRVGGYSARFVDLGRDLQDTLIARAEQAL